VRDGVAGSAIRDQAMAVLIIRCFYNRLVLILPMNGSLEDYFQQTGTDNEKKQLPASLVILLIIVGHHHSYFPAMDETIPDGKQRQAYAAGWGLVFLCSHVAFIDVIFLQYCGPVPNCIKLKQPHRKKISLLIVKQPLKKKLKQLISKYGHMTALGNRQVTCK
jgi:hypothetical protein